MRIGYLAVSDCAPLVYASESGLFEKYGLEVHLQRETSWANVRDKVIYGELDAAHAPATLPFLANLGIESDPCACVSGLVLSLQGNSVTISRRLWDEGVRDAAGLRDKVYKNWGKRTFTFGVVFSLSSQVYPGKPQNAKVFAVNRFTVVNPAPPCEGWSVINFSRA